MFTSFSKDDLIKPIKSLQFISTQKNLRTFSMNVWLTASFLTHWKEQMLLRFLKKEVIMGAKTITEWVCSHHLQKCLKNYCLSKLIIVCKVNSQSILLVSAKTTTQNARCEWLWSKIGEQLWIKNSKWMLFYGFIKSIWYLRSLLVVVKIECVWFWWYCSPLSFVQT